MSKNETAIATIDVSEGADLLQIVRLTAMNVNGMSQQMGLLNARMNTMGERMGKIEERQDKLDAEMTVTRAQAARIKKAIHSRVAYVLKLEYDGGRVGDRWIGKDKRYRGAFLTRAWVDAKYRSKCGDPYYTTLKADFAEVMDYIDAWEPEVKGGVEGYKHYLDVRHKESVQ